MDQKKHSMPLPLRQVFITDDFWKKEMELVRNEIIPYQWRALNDQVEGAEPSFCMRNFKVAGKQNEQRRIEGDNFAEPEYTFRGFQSLPEDMGHLEDKFYGFVFQDSDFYKWVEAVAYSLTQHPDAELEKRADEAIETVCAAQQEDGYLDTYYIINGKDKIFSNLRDHHELYCFGHLAEGAVAYYQATGKDRLLNAAKRFADYIGRYFGPEEGKCKGYPGHEIAEMALVRLYEATGEDKYLRLGQFFVEERGKQPYYFETAEKHPNITNEAYHQSHLPVRMQDEAVGHAVRGVYLYSGMADLARLNQDDELFSVCERLWDNIVREKMYVTGGIGATHLGEAFSFGYDLPNDTAYAETCAAIGLVFFARRMLQISPQRKYADIMELALYNSVLSGMALDGKSFFYVNPLEVVPKACHSDERKAHVKPVRQKWFGCACCPPNLARLLSSIGSYVCTVNDDALFIHQYIGCTVEPKQGNAPEKVMVESQFPWDGAVSVRTSGTKGEYTIAMRLPGWCGSPSASVSAGGGITELNMRELQERECVSVCCGKKQFTVSVCGGYLLVRGVWGAQDAVSLDFPMEVQVLEGDSRIREDIGKAAVRRGPVVYCAEEVDNGADLHLLSVDANASPVVYDKIIGGISVKAVQMEGSRREPVTVHGHMGPYQQCRKTGRKKTTITYVPYYTWANRGENEMSVWMTEE